VKVADGKVTALTQFGSRNCPTSRGKQTSKHQPKIMRYHSLKLL